MGSPFPYLRVCVTPLKKRNLALLHPSSLSYAIQTSNVLKKTPFPPRLLTRRRAFLTEHTQGGVCSRGPPRGDRAAAGGTFLGHGPARVSGAGADMASCCSPCVVVVTGCCSSWTLPGVCSGKRGSAAGQRGAFESCCQARQLGPRAAQILRCLSGVSAHCHKCQTSRVRLGAGASGSGLWGGRAHATNSCRRRPGACCWPPRALSQPGSLLPSAEPGH